MSPLASALPSALAAEGAARHTPWCTEHAAGPDQRPAACWAEPLDVRLYPAAGRDLDDDGESGHLTLLMRHTDAAPRYGRTRPTEIVFDRFPDGEDGSGMDPDEAEIAAFALLALVAQARGDVVTAGVYRGATDDLAAALLSRREHAQHGSPWPTQTMAKIAPEGGA